jgi:hypothetical protein
LACQGTGEGEPGLPPGAGQPAADGLGRPPKAVQGTPPAEDLQAEERQPHRQGPLPRTATGASSGKKKGE